MCIHAYRIEHTILHHRFTSIVSVDTINQVVAFLYLMVSTRLKLYTATEFLTAHVMVTIATLYLDSSTRCRVPLFTLVTSDCFSRQCSHTEIFDRSMTDLMRSNKTGRKFFHRSDFCLFQQSNNDCSFWHVIHTNPARNVRISYSYRRRYYRLHCSTVTCVPVAPPAVLPSGCGAILAAPVAAVRDVPETNYTRTINTCLEAALD